MHNAITNFLITKAYLQKKLSNQKNTQMQILFLIISRKSFTISKQANAFSFTQNFYYTFNHKKVTFELVFPYQYKIWQNNIIFIT